MGGAEDGAIVAGEDLDVAFVAVIAVGEEPGYGTWVAGDARFGCGWRRGGCLLLRIPSRRLIGRLVAGRCVGLGGLEMWGCRGLGGIRVAIGGAGMVVRSGSGEQEGGWEILTDEEVL